MNIDWSKAPEWAEYAVIGPLSGNVYFANDNKRQRDHDCALFNVGKDGADSHINDGWRRIDRPSSEWNGKGLPPVGTFCELRNGPGGWGRATITHQGKGLTAWLWDHVNPDQVEYAECPDRLEFRPIRTREQIAAEQAEREIDAICYDIVSHYENPKGSEHYLGLARALHFAGYRKQEQPK